VPGRHRKRPSPVLPIATGALGVTAVLLGTASATPPLAAAPAPAPAPVALVAFTADAPTEWWLTTVPRRPVVKPEPVAAPAQPAAVTQPTSAPLRRQKATVKVVTPKRGEAKEETVSVSSSRAGAIVAAALAQRGVMYRYGGTTPAGFDCSGLLKFAYAKAGLNLPRTSSAQSRVGTTVSLANIQPGDRLHYGGHVALAIGGGKLIESSTTGRPVAVRAIYTRGLQVVKRGV
jgi:peptidoglycan DL-endopeptidase CwlO